MPGITVAVIIPVPIALQVFMLAIKQEKRNREVKEILRRIEKSLRTRIKVIKNTKLAIC